MCVCVTENTNMAVFVTLEKKEQGFPINWMSVEKSIRHIVFGETFFLANNTDNTVTLWKQTNMNGHTSFYPLHQTPGENQKKVILVNTSVFEDDKIFLAYEPEQGHFLTFTCDGIDKVF